MARQISVPALGKILGSPHFLWLLPTLTVGLLAFGLDLGWAVDDHIHRAALTRPPELPELHRTPARLFAFVDGDAEQLEPLIQRGIWPWFSSPDLRLAFWRPVAGWSHAFDYFVWPDSPWLMHVHSLAWYALTVTLLLLLYRRLLPRPELAGLAALLFAIDDSQAFPALWLANRNAVLAVCFGITALIAHDRWRRDGWRAGSVLGPLALLAAVLANEGAVAIGGYFLAYALCLDRAPWRQRLLALAPATTVGLIWALAYKLGEFGAQSSGVYIDPIAEPLRFAAMACQRLPVLLWGWWGFPPADLANVLPDALRLQFLLLIGLMLGLLFWLLRPILRAQPVARFLALGMLLALVPAGSTFPSNRLLGFVGIGAAGLLALLLTDLTRARPEQGRLRRWAARSACVGLVLIHLLAAPLLSRLMIDQMANFDTLLQKTADSLVELTGQPRTSDPQTVVVVAVPSTFIALGASTVATMTRDWQPRRQLVLSASIYDTEVSRPDSKTLILRPLGGLLRRPTAPAPGEDAGPALDPLKSLLMLDHLFRDLEREPFAPGDRVPLLGVELEILATEDGRPLAIACHFDHPLESNQWRWLAWREGRYQAFPLPAVGGRSIWAGAGG